MSDDNEPVTRKDLPDELPRSAVSGKRLPRLSGPSRSAAVGWAVLAVLAIVAFAAMLWVLRDPGGRPSPASSGAGAPVTNLR